MKKIVFGLSLLTTLLAAGAAGATVDRIKNIPASPIYHTTLSVPANVGYTLTTSNLSAGSDTVIHVQSTADANGGFVAGNDDYNGLASQVTIAPVATARTLDVYVRGYGTASGGTATLQMTGTNGANQVINIQFGGYVQTVSGGMISTAHVMTTEQQGGATDTVVLVVSGSAANAISSDDNDGVDKMSWLHLDTPCSSTYCRVIVGSYSPANANYTTLTMDEGNHVANCDSDGVGDALETKIGTDPCKSDTDGDGLLDGNELIGVVEGAAGPAVKLPAYGADPVSQKDLFVELDWVACTAAGCSASGDDYRVPGAMAQKVAAYYAPDVKVHIDNGVTNTDPATREIWGNWGGAKKIADGTAYCQMLAPERVGLFHHGIMNGWGGGQADSYNGYCFTAGLHDTGGNIAHEIAHGLGLYHGGSPDNDINCKANYHSPMNYSFIYESTLTQFSRNQFGSVVLNPLSVDESYGFGTSDMSKIGYLKNWPLYLNVSASGQIDWTRDGTYDAGLVPAPVTWFDASCEQSVHGTMGTAPVGGWPGSKHLVAGWVKTAGGVPRIYQVSRRVSDGLLQSRYALGSALDTCRTNPVASCATWTPAQGAAPSLVPGSLGGSLAPAVARVPGSPERLLVVYPDTGNKLRYQLLGVSAGNVETWTAPAFVGSGAEVLDADPALVTYSGLVYAYASTGGVLKRWTFTPATSTWTGPVTQQWSDGTNVVVQQGIGVTAGYQKDVAGEQMFAVMQVASPAPAHLVLARYNTGTSRWVAFPSSIWHGGAINEFHTLSRPSLAYEPFNAAVPTDGRFFVTFQRDPNEGILIAMTEGNDGGGAATARRLIWPTNPIFLFNVWQLTNGGGVSLLFDRTYDKNLRATWTPWTSGEQFAPLADGIFNVNLKDNDDYARIKANLACSLTRSCP